MSTNTATTISNTSSSSAASSTTAVTEATATAKPTAPPTTTPALTPTPTTFDTFQRNFQEGLSKKEILSHLLPPSTSSPEAQMQRTMVRTIMKEREVIYGVFKATSKKLVTSFVYSLRKPKPQPGQMAVVLVIFKLAVLFDIYQKIAPSIHPKIQQMFEPVAAAVAKAKQAAHQQRKNHQLHCRVDTIVKEIMETTFAETGLVVGRRQVRRPAWVSGDIHAVRALAASQKRALARYRSILGLGSRALTEAQMYRVVMDAVRSAPVTMNATLATAALDAVLGIDERSAGSAHQSQPAAGYPL